MNDRTDGQRDAVLAFHKMTTGFSFGSTNVNPVRFAGYLEALRGWGYRFVPLREMGAPGEGRRAAITFDDGYRHLKDHLPRLIGEYGFEPTVFVPTAFLGKGNSWDYSHWFRNEPHLSAGEIRELARAGVRFGSHGHGHVDLTAVDDERLREELVRSRGMLEEMVGEEVREISYPFGCVDGRVVEAAEGAGYRIGVTMRFPEGADRALTMGRYGVWGYDTVLSLKRKLAPGRWRGVERIKAGVTNRLSAGTRLVNRLRGTREEPQG